MRRLLDAACQDMRQGRWDEATAKLEELAVLERSLPHRLYAYLSEWAPWLTLALVLSVLILNACAAWRLTIH
jgi:hypothetical protein